MGPIRCHEHIEETISLLSVPDTFATLAGGYQLAWRPVPGETAEAAVGVLAGLFAEHGAPLVLKTDNGSGLAAEPVRGLLQGHGVQALFSPPRTPQYNGSAEAGIGAVKVRTQVQVSTSQMRIVRSKLPLASRCPSGCHAME